MTARYLVADVFDGLATIDTGSVDLVVTSPPFLALRSYLPADHPDKSKEIGSEATPAEFIDVMLRVTAELRRVLAPHGSICIELGDTYSGSSMSGGDDATNDRYPAGRSGATYGNGRTATKGAVDGWPLAKSKALIAELYRVALAYGINPLTGTESSAGRWRIRNVVTWVRPNPPVGALGDKWRPATSDLTIACTSAERYWDDLATRKPHTSPDRTQVVAGARVAAERFGEREVAGRVMEQNSAGAPLLDWWEIPPGGYSGKTLTVHREPCGPLDGGERTTSLDCPVHAGLPGQLPKALRDAHAGTDRTHTPRTDDRHESEPLPGFAPTDATPARSDSSQLPTTETSDPGYSPAAKPRSKASSRTVPAPGTNPPDTPSVETTPRTGGKSTSPESDEHHPGTSESNTLGDGSTATPRSRTAARTVDNRTDGAASEACSCSYSRVVKEEYTSHYAVFPPALVEPLVKAMAPPKVCRTCGEPSRRIVENTPEYDAARRGGDIYAETSAVNRGTGMHGGTRPPGLESSERVSLGWTSCGHDNYRPGHVLDCFAGSGTTGVVATGHGHDVTLIDLDERNCELARERIGPFLFEEVTL